MKLNDIAIALLIFIIVSLILSFLDILSISFQDILSYSLITIGISLVYSEVIRQNRSLIFLGSLIFLAGIYFLIVENFDVHINGGMSLPIILISCGSGLLMVYISKSTQKIFLIVSVIILSAGLVLFIVKCNWSGSSYIESLLSVANFLWPVAILIVILVLLLRIK
jgi:hypothetical protein